MQFLKMYMEKVTKKSSVQARFPNFVSFVDNVDNVDYFIKY
jgi:hypothetical protein